MATIAAVTLSVTLASAAASAAMQGVSMAASAAAADANRSRAEEEASLLKSDQMKEMRRRMSASIVAGTKNNFEISGTVLDKMGSIEASAYENIARIGTGLAVKKSFIDTAESNAIGRGAGSILGSISGGVSALNQLGTFDPKGGSSPGTPKLPGSAGSDFPDFLFGRPPGG